MDMNGYFSTRDLAEAALLYSSHKKLIRLEKDIDKFWFIFEDKTSCQKLADSFWRRDAVVNARDFADALRCLKDLIFNREK